MLPYTESGSGEIVLLFLHFFGSSQLEWRHVIAGLNAGYRCVAADMPGFGEAASIPGYSVSEMAAQVDALVERFAPAPVVLIGHSMSGKVCMVVSSTPPANLRRLILVAPSPLLPEPMSEDARATMAIANTTQERAETFVRDGAHHALDAEDFRSAVQDVFRSNPEAWRAWPESGAREDWSSRITELRVPTDLIAGDRDPSIPLDFQRKHTLPLVTATGGKLTVIKDAAHLLPYEAAAALTETIAESLASDHRS